MNNKNIEEFYETISFSQKFYRLIFKKHKNEEFPKIEVYSELPKEEYINNIILYDYLIIGKSLNCNKINDIYSSTYVLFLIKIFNEEEEYYAICKENKSYNFKNYYFITNNIKEAKRKFMQDVNKIRFK